jgi:hypothetical protein
MIFLPSLFPIQSDKALRSLLSVRSNRDQRPTFPYATQLVIPYFMDSIINVNPYVSYSHCLLRPACLVPVRSNHDQRPTFPYATQLAIPYFMESILNINPYVSYGVTDYFGRSV